MTFRIFLMLGAGLALAACEPEKGTGFTGIGPAASQSVPGGYALDFSGHLPASGHPASGGIPAAGRR